MISGGKLSRRDVAGSPSSPRTEEVIEEEMKDEIFCKFFFYLFWESWEEMEDKVEILLFKEWFNWSRR